jgi:hypothetical protein
MKGSGALNTGQAYIVSGGRHMTPTTEYLTIPLTQGQFAIVDAADYEWLSQWKWCAEWKPGSSTFYASRTSYTEGRYSRVYMHREILGLERGDKRRGDHRDFNGLNNRRDNLRIATPRQNQTHQRMHRTNTNGFRGVVPVKRKNGMVYEAYIRIAGGKRKYLGLSHTIEQAGALYDKADMELNKQFASYRLVK